MQGTDQSAGCRLVEDDVGGQTGAVSNHTGLNSYSPAWFEFFHVGIPAARTELETAFIQQSCPLPRFTRVLDVCSGMGRHTRVVGGWLRRDRRGKPQHHL